MSQTFQDENILNVSSKKTIKNLFYEVWKSPGNITLYEAAILYFINYIFWFEIKLNNSNQFLVNFNNF